MFSEPEETTFPQLTDSHALLSGSGFFRSAARPVLTEEVGGEGVRGGSDVPCPPVPRGPSEHGRDGAKRCHGCPNENQMAKEEGSCGYSWEPAWMLKPRS